MPYVKQSDRLGLIEEAYWGAETAGELNFVFTHFIVAYLEKHGKSYQRFNDIIGALEGAKLELYRREIAPLKLHENGEVY